MNAWVRENVASSSYGRGSEERVDAYTAECLDEAARQGVTRQEIEEDIGDVGGYIRDAMDEAARAELHSDSAEDE